jgi:sulfate adenylyltransferase subunit 2
LLSTSPWLKLRAGEVPEKKIVRFRTCGDMPITGAVESDADTLEKIIDEVAASRKTERGTRADDKRSETSMEDRKKSGYF